MEFKFHCPHCDRSLAADEELIGLVIQCPDCDGTIKVPGTQIDENLPIAAPAPAPTPPQEPARQTNVSAGNPMVEDPKSGLPLAALLLGIGGIFTCGLTAVPAVICGHLAVRRSRISGRAVEMKTIVGMILGYLVIGVFSISFVLGILAGLVSPDSKPVDRDHKEQVPADAPPDKKERENPRMSFEKDSYEEEEWDWAAADKAKRQAAAEKAEADRLARADKKETVHKEGDSIHVGYTTYAVKRSWWSTKLSDNQFLNKSPNATYLFVEIYVRNNDKKARMVPPFQLIDENGAEYDSSSNAVMVDGAIGLLETLNPSVNKQGFIVFDVPKNRKYRMKLSGGYWSGSNAYVQLNPKNKR